MMINKITILPNKTKIFLVFIYSVTFFLGLNFINGGSYEDFLTPSSLIYPEIITALYALLIAGLNTWKEIKIEKEGV